jgi:hypothetical protein
MPEILTAGATVLYVIGFVVANAYRSRYEIVRFEPFRGRYAAAGLLFATVALIPGFFGWNVGAWYRMGEVKEKTRGLRPGKLKRQLISAFAVPVGCCFSAILTWSLLQSAVVGHVALWWLAVFALPVESAFATSGSFVTKMRLSRLSWWSQLSRERMGAVFFLTIAAAAVFGAGVYPHISPAFGGSAAALARVELKPSSVSAVLEAAFRRPVAVIDRDEQLIDVVACTDSSASIVHSVSVPSTSVQAVILHGLIALPEAEHRLCPDVPRR